MRNQEKALSIFAALWLVAACAMFVFAPKAHAQCGGSMIATPTPFSGLLVEQSLQINVQFGPLGSAATINAVIVTLDCQNATGCDNGACLDDGNVLQYNGDDTIANNTCGQAISTGLGNGDTFQNTITFTFANPINLAAGATCSFRFGVTIKSFSNDATPKAITGTARTSGTCTNTLPLAACGSYIIFLADPKIQIVKSVTPTEICEGTSVKYSYTVTNPGDVPLHSVVVIDDNGTPGFPDDDFSPTFVGGDVGNIGFLDPSETWTYTYSTDSLPVGTTTNIARVAGSYTNAVTTVVVNDDDDAIVIVHPNPEVEVFGEKICNSEGTGQICAVVTGGTAPYTVCWYKDGILVPDSCTAVLVEGGQACLVVNDRGQYCAVVTDFHGCVSGLPGDDCGSIDINPNPLVTVTNEKVCQGACGNLLATVAGGTAPYAVQWYNAQGQPVGKPCTNVQENGQCVLNVCDAQTYTAKVVDDKGCEGEDSGALRFNPLPTCYINANRDKICAGQTATLCAVVTGGTPPYTYEWNTGETFLCLLNVDEPGHYSVTVTDSKGCSTVCEFDLASHHVDIEVTCTPVGDQIQLCANVFSGRPPMQFRWSTGSQEQCVLVNPLPPCFTYVVTALDSNQCKDAAVFALELGVSNTCECPGQANNCPCDINLDSVVGVPDLLAIISSWGPCSPPCAADVAPPAGDGVVGVPDLLSVISNWGPCN